MLWHVLAGAAETRTPKTAEKSENGRIEESQNKKQIAACVLDPAVFVVFGGSREFLLFVALASGG